MARLIKKERGNYTNTSNLIIRDDRLHWNSRGIFVYLWSQANEWQFYVKEIVKHSPGGETELRTALKELEKYGYLKRTPRHGQSGSFNGMDWILSDVGGLNRHTENPDDGSINENQPKEIDYPSSAKPVERETRRTDNRTLRNNNNKNYQQQEITKESNTNSASHSNAQCVSQLEEEFEEVWSKYPNKKGKKQAFNHYKAWRKASIKHTNEYLLDQLNKYLTYCQQNNSWYHPMNGSTWFNGRFDDVLITEDVSNKPKKRIYD